MYLLSYITIIDMPRHLMQASQVRVHYKDLIVCGKPQIMDRALTMPRPFWEWLNKNYMAGSKITISEYHLSAWLNGT